MIFNRDTIRRVDVNTMEIKKNIDIYKITRALPFAINDMQIYSVTMVPEFVMPPNNEIVEQSEIDEELKQNEE